jgi:hypothetical protein
MNITPHHDRPARQQAAPVGAVIGEAMFDEIFYDEWEPGIGSWKGQCYEYDEDGYEGGLSDREQDVEFEPPALEDGLDHGCIYEAEIEKRGEGDDARYVVTKVGDVIAGGEG